MIQPHELFAYIYDSLQNIGIILTSSEVGVLKDFLEIETGSSPLFGRYVEEIFLKPFSKEKSFEFLKNGFEEIGMDAPESILREAVERLDGIVGWLVFFGRKSMEIGRVDLETLDEILKAVEKVVKKGLKNLEKMSRRYTKTLKVISLGENTWKGIKDGLEVLEKREIQDASFSKILRGLEKMGFIERKFNKRGYKERRHRRLGCSSPEIGKRWDQALQPRKRWCSPRLPSLHVRPSRDLRIHTR